MKQTSSVHEMLFDDACHEAQTSGTLCALKKGYKRLAQAERAPGAPPWMPPLMTTACRGAWGSRSGLPRRMRGVGDSGSHPAPSVRGGAHLRREAFRGG